MGSVKLKTISLMFNPSIPTKIRLQFGDINITPEVINRLNDLGYTVPEFQQAIARHKSLCDGEPAVYCGTYGKYSSGSICGLWVDLSSFDYFDEFINFCKAIHADEADPELMFQDYCGFPGQWYRESGMDAADFIHIQEYCELCEKYDRDAVDDCLEVADDITDFEDTYCGQWDCAELFARHIIEECYNIEEAMGALSGYFDFEAYARDLFLTDYSMGSNGNVFRRA